MSLRYQTRRGLFALPILALLFVAGFRAPVQCPPLPVQTRSNAEVVLMLRVGKTPSSAAVRGAG